MINKISYNSIPPEMNKRYFYFAGNNLQLLEYLLAILSFVPPGHNYVVKFLLQGQFLFFYFLGRQQVVSAISEIIYI